MTALDRAQEACVVLRKALNVVPARTTRRDAAGGSGGGSDAAALAAALRRAAARLPVSYVCDHWARAVADAETPSPFATSARDGKILKPVQPASSRMTATEMSRALLDIAVGHEKEWRDEMVAAWLSSSRGGYGGSDDDDGGSGSFGRGGRSRFFLASVRARAYMRIGRHEQALRDARVAMAYAPRVSAPAAPAFIAAEGGGGQVKSLPPPPSTPPTTPTTRVDHFSSKSRAAAAHALLATALEAVASEACADDIDLDASFRRSGIREDSVGPSLLSGDDDDMFITDSDGGGGFAGYTMGKQYGGGGIGDDEMSALIDDRDHRDTGMSSRTHASTGGLGRVVLSQAGEGGRSEDLIVDAGVAAAVEWRRAVDLAPDNERYAVSFSRAATCHLAEKPRRVLVEQGAEAAVEWFEKDKVANLPEYVRPRPKYYYFYEWMRERIEEHYPNLPEPVMDKLLATDAGELDLLLQYPRAIKGQVEEYLDVFRAEGGKYLETYRTPQLTWREVKALKGRGTVGLGPAGEVNGFGEVGPPPPLPDLLEDEEEDYDYEEDTDRAMLGAAGDEGLTAEEAAGLMMNGSGGGGSSAGGPRITGRGGGGRGPSLPPDQLRAVHHATERRAAAASTNAGGYLPSSAAGKESSTSSSSSVAAVAAPSTRKDTILSAGVKGGAIASAATKSTTQGDALVIQNMEDMD